MDYSFLLKKRPNDSRTKKKEEFYRLALANTNIRSALHTCDAFIELISKWEGKTLPFKVSDAFISTIIVTYSKPFVGTRKGRPGELSKKWKQFKNQGLQKTHNEMLANRHSLFAHTDAESHRLMVIPNGCLPKTIGQKPPQVAYKIEGTLIPPQNVVRYRAVCRDIQSRLESAVENALSELYEGMDLPNREFYLRFDDGL